MTSIRRLACALALALPTIASAQLDVAGLDKSIDACSDLYGFANRKWLEATAIPDDRTAWGTFSIIAQRNEKILEAAFQDALATLPPEGTAKRKVALFYRSGMDTAAIEKAGLAPLQPLFRAIDGIDSPRKLADVIAQLHAAGIPVGFRFDVDPDARDSSRYLVALAQGGLGMPDRDLYLLDDERSKKLRAGYLAHVEKMLALAGAAPEAARHDAERVMALETVLAQGSSTRVERRDPVKNYNRMTLAGLQEAAPGFAWQPFFAGMGARTADEADVQQPKFFTTFAQAAASRPTEDWRAYLRWHVLAATANTLPAAFEAESFDFNERQVKGTKALAPRHRRVLLAIGGPYGAEGLGQAIGQVYVGKAFPPEAKARALALVDNVKEALRARLRKVDWMSPETRAASLGKLDAMDVKIGYPDRWRDFSDADVGAYSFVENWLHSRAFDVRRQVKRLGQPVDKSEWLLSPHIVNAYYNRNANEIVFPAAILQPPYFDAKADDPYNYGGIGMVIGHEITHGFDDTGRQFDAKGNLREWWTAEDTKRYMERAQRAVTQYGAYEGPEGTKLNGQLTLGENLADVGGLKIAYDALQRALAKKPEGVVDGFTPEQRFFIAFAQDWRLVMRPEFERTLIMTDPHSLARYRVKGPIRQLPEFAKAFSCDARLALLPEDQRTNLW